MNNSLTHNGASLMNILRNIETTINNKLTTLEETITNYISLNQPYYNFEIYINFTSVTSSDELYDVYCTIGGNGGFQFWRVTSKLQICKEEDQVQQALVIPNIRAYKLYYDNSLDNEVNNVFMFRTNPTGKYYFVDQYFNRLGLIPKSTLYGDKTINSLQYEMLPNIKGYDTNNIPILEEGQTAAMFYLENHPEIWVRYTTTLTL